MASPFRAKEPVTKINGVNPSSLATIELTPNKRVSAIMLEMSVTATGGATQRVYAYPFDILGQIQVKVGGKPQRTRMAYELFGQSSTNVGLNTICDSNAAGTVQYFTGAATAAWPLGTPVTTTVNGLTVGLQPVLMGSQADLALQAAIAANTPCTTQFQLPIQFDEPFRKSYATSDALSLVQGFDDGTNVGLTTIELSLGGTSVTPLASQPRGSVATTAITLSNLTCKAYYEYDNSVQKAGTAVRIVKEYRHNVQYSAAGDIECASQLYLRDRLTRVSLLTQTPATTGTPDIITRVVVKFGQQVVRDITNPRSVAELLRKDYNSAASFAYRFDIEFDENDDPNQAPVMDPTVPLSIVATLASATGSPSNITVLSSYYGPLD